MCGLFDQKNSFLIVTLLPLPLYQLFYKKSATLLFVFKKKVNKKV